ncbi:MAG: guanylate kinase [Clostridia bacterium]|nr:guanylate kinase [Clostridia bacterium]
MTDGSGFLLIFSGPSGSGKDTVIHDILARDDKTVVSISMTTRAPRVGEVDGVDYYFVTKDEFESHIKNDEMLEWAQYGDNYYGTPKAPVAKWIEEGKTVILEIEVQGADKIRAKYPDVRTMFLMPPSLHILESRLRDRGTNSEDDIKARLDVAKSEIGRASDYDYIIVNNRLEDAVEDALEIIFRHRRHLRESGAQDEFYYGHQYKELTIDDYIDKDARVLPPNEDFSERGLK